MYTFTKRLRSAMVVIGVAAMTLIPIASPTVLAACSGVGVQVASASAWGYESASNGTCDGLNDYNGIYRDTVTDGYLVRIRTRYVNLNSNWAYTPYTNGLNINYWVGYWDNVASVSSGTSNTHYQIGRSDGIYASLGVNWGF